MKKIKTLLIVGAVHGDEKVGVEVIKRLGKVIDKKKVFGLIANHKALAKQVRFIDSDLNRSFPGANNGNYEQKLANNLLKKIRRYAYVVDFHSFSCKSEPFAILTKKSEEHFLLAESLGIKKIILMSSELASGRSLIDYCTCGVSVEAGKHNLEATYKRATNYGLKALERLRSFKAYSVKKNRVEYFEVVGILFKKMNEEIEESITNFKLVYKGEIIARDGKRLIKSPYSFYPVLAREKSYSNILCLATKPVKIRERRKYD